jgi:hypothetical protein
LPGTLSWNDRSSRLVEFTSEENLRIKVFVEKEDQLKVGSAIHLHLLDRAPKIDSRFDNENQVSAFAFLRHDFPFERPWTEDTHVRRRFALLGRTFDDGQVWDARRAIAALRMISKDTKIILHADGQMAAIALYAGLFEPSVERFELYDLPTSHRDGPAFLNVMRVLDMPQAVALAFPRSVVLHGADPEKWKWPAAVANFYDSPLQFKEPRKK